MYASEQDVRLSAVPWPLLIRARTGQDFGRAALGTVAVAVSTISGVRARETLQRAAAHDAAHLETDPASGRMPGNAEEVFRLAADVDDWCGTVPISVLIAWLLHHGGVPHGGGNGPIDPGGPVESAFATATDIGLVAAVARFAGAAGLSGVHAAAEEVLKEAAAGHGR